MACSISAVRGTEKYGISPDSVRSCCLTDLSFDLQYKLSWILLTDDSLILLSSDKIQPSMDFSSHAIPDICEDCSVKTIPIKNCSKLYCEPMVASVLLVAEIDGVETVLAASSNANAEQIHSFIEAFNQVTMPNSTNAANSKSAYKKPAPKSKATAPNSKLELIKSKGSTFFRLLGFFKPYKLHMFFTILCFVATGLISIITPYLNGSVLFGEVLDGAQLGENAVTSNALLALLAVAATMLGIKIANQFFNFLHSIIVAKFVPFVIRDVKSKVFSSMSKLSIKFYQNRETGSLMTRVLSDAQEVTYLFIDHLPAVLVDLVTVSAALVIMFVLNWKLALLAVCLIPAPAVVTMIIIPLLWTAHGRKHRAMRNLNSQINDNLTGARVVRAFGSQEGEMQRFTYANSKVGDNEVEIGTIESKLHAFYTAAKEIIVMAIYGVGAYMILGGSFNIDYAMLITFMGYIGMLTGPVDTISRFVKQWVNCMNCAGRIFEIIDAEPDVIDAENPVHLPDIKGDVALENVCFSYEIGKEVLKDVSLSVKSGEMLGLVGQSGAGKSTILNLISRLYDVDKGRVLIDGVDIRDISLNDLHGVISMVSQETYIFMGTVAENIAYTRPNASREDIVNAAVAAAAHDFIMKLPDGYDTVIGSTGHALSGGERQRLSIARAILANPKILILDEATASVDTETEIKIQLALEELIKGRTTIVVAHRLSTLRGANHIAVIENGKITERGSHEELMKQKGTYYRLATIQIKALSKGGIIE